MVVAVAVEQRQYAQYETAAAVMEKQELSCRMRRPWLGGYWQEVGVINKQQQRLR